MQELTGVIVINKPSGITSFDCIRVLKKIAGKKVRIGHMGTLDPLASGVLPIMLGRATKLFDVFLDKSKTYLAEMQFGTRTDTGDITGTVVAHKEVPMLSAEIIDDVMKGFRGGYLQQPPIFSAKKVHGERSYKLARENKISDDDLEPVFVRLEEAHVLSYDEETQSAIIRITVGKGFYVRSFIEDVAAMLDTVAVMSSLQRIQVGDFFIDKSINIDIIKTREDLMNTMISIEDVTASIETICVSDEIARRIENGGSLSFDIFKNIMGFVRIVDKKGSLKAIGFCDEDKFEYRIVIGEHV